MPAEHPAQRVSLMPDRNPRLNRRERHMLHSDLVQLANRVGQADTAQEQADGLAALIDKASAYHRKIIGV